MTDLDLDAIEARQLLADAAIDRGRWDDVAESQADVPALVARVRELEQQLEQAKRFGIGEFRATHWAYSQACEMIEKQRDRADRAEAQLRKLQS